MKRIAFVPPAVVVLAVLASGCGSSVDLPSREESRQTISALKPMIDSLDTVIAEQGRSLPKGYDIISRTRLSAVNALLDRVTTSSVNDIHIDFLRTAPLWKEEKSILGISYTNHVDIDTGTLDIDLKKFRFTSTENNIVNAEIEIEGSGIAKVSGQYTGIPATAAPRVQFYLNDRIQFALTVADSDYIKLTPLPKSVLLKVKVSINLLGWSIPYSKEIPLQSVDLIKPVMIPSALRSEVVFPIPAAQFGEQQYEFVRRYITFTKTTVRTFDNMLEYRGNIDLTKE